MSSTAEAAAALLAQRTPADALEQVAEQTVAVIQGDEAEHAPSSPEAAAPVAHDAAPPEGFEEFQLGEPEPEDAYWLTDDDEPLMDDEPEPTALEDDDEFADPEVARLKKALAAEQKRAAHYEQQNAKTARKAWIAEAQKYYPLAAIETIDATSKRAFMRTAKAQHEHSLPAFKRYQEVERKRLRAEAAAQWGTPVQGAGGVPSAAAEYERELEQARKTGSASKVFKTMLLGGRRQA